MNKFNGFFVLLCFCAWFSCCRGKNQVGTESGNHLIHESSAYLLQHAHNPVDWYPWGDEALQKAIAEKKLMIISIGYSSCHWCHVMERETFSDTSVSRIMNADFVNIKVDREERPDIDNIYMNACQIMNPDGGCGWPLNAIALPDGRPVWVGTYLTRDEWMGLLKQITELYHEDQNDLQKIANQISNHLQIDHRFKLSSEKLEFKEADLKAIQGALMNNLDLQSGGKKGDIKFPLPPLIRCMMEYSQFSKETAPSTWHQLTIQNLVQGGLFDQLYGGFARYSTDAQWKVPHFEKMLYDNAQLTSVLSDALKMQSNVTFRRYLDKNLQFLMKEFTAGDGKYYSSFDAESEGEEGKYYVWTFQEVKQILTDETDFQRAVKVYGLTESGNWEKGKNVLRMVQPVEILAKNLGLKLLDFYQQLDRINAKLEAARKLKPAPKRDEKIVCSWNALTAIGFADAYAATGQELYREEAIKIASFIQKDLLTPDMKLYRTFSKGRANQMAFLDDYAATVLAFIRMYEISFDEQWLNASKALCDQVIKQFSDEEGVYFYFNEKEGATLIARKREMIDQVLPSSNSMMADALHKLGLYFYDNNYLQRSQHMVKGIMEGPGKQDPVFYGNWIRLYVQFVKPPYEVAIVGSDFAKLQKQMLSKYTPHAILLGGSNEGTLELLKEKLQEGSTYIYVCRNKVCKLPVTSVEEAIKLMN